MSSLSISTSLPSITSNASSPSKNSIYSPSNLNPPFGLDFHKDDDDFEFDSDRQSPGYRKGGPKEARLKKNALLGAAKELDHLHPIKIHNIPDTIRPETIKKEFEEFGTIEDIYIPIDAERRKAMKDFAVIRFTDKEAVEKSLTLSNQMNKVLDGKSVVVGPLKKQTSFFSNGTGYLGICNEVVDDEESKARTMIIKTHCEQDIPLSSCMARSGAPWTSLRELKFLAPHPSPKALEKHTLKITNIPNILTPEQIKEYFSKYGELEDVKCPKPLLVNQRSKYPNNGVAFIRFDDKRDLEIALNDIKNGNINFEGMTPHGEHILPPVWPSEKTRRYY